MEDFVFEPWELERENDKFVSVFRWGERKDDEFGEVQRIRVTLTLGKGDNPSVLEIYDACPAHTQLIECDDFPDLLNKMESFLTEYYSRKRIRMSWISVTEALPEECQLVLTKTELSEIDADIDLCRYVWGRFERYIPNQPNCYGATMVIREDLTKTTKYWKPAN